MVSGLQLSAAVIPCTSNSLGYRRLPKLAILRNPSCSTLTAAGCRLWARLLQAPPPLLPPPPDTDPTPGPCTERKVENRIRPRQQSTNHTYYFVTSQMSRIKCDSTMILLQCIFWIQHYIHIIWYIGSWQPVIQNTPIYWLHFLIIQHQLSMIILNIFCIG